MINDHYSPTDTLFEGLFEPDRMVSSLFCSWSDHHPVLLGMAGLAYVGSYSTLKPRPFQI